MTVMVLHAYVPMFVTFNGLTPYVGRLLAASWEYLCVHEVVPLRRLTIPLYPIIHQLAIVFLS